MRSMSVRGSRFQAVAALVTAASIMAGAAASSPAQPTPDTLSIEECARMAHDRSPDVLISALTWGAAHADSVAAQRNRWPAFSVFGHVTLSPSGFYDPTITNLGEYMLKAGVELPLLDGGERARERARAANRAVSASIDLDRTRREAALRAASLAITILRLREQLRAHEEAFGWLDRLTSLLQAGARSGSRSTSEALRTGLDRDAMRISLENTGVDLSVAERELGQLLGLGASSAPGIREPRPSEDVAPAAADSIALLGSLERAPEVRTRLVTRRDQEIALQEARRKNALRVDGSADAGLAGADLTHVVPPDLKESNPDAGLADRLHRDLGASATVEFHRPFADPRVGPTIEARRRDLEAARLSLENETETQRRVRSDVLTRWEAAARNLALAEHSASQATDHVIKMRSLYTAGASSLLELLDARHVLDDALDRLAEARAESRAARFEAETRR
jgi:outer membrane protein TolC